MHTTPYALAPSPTAQPWGSCGNIRNEADARDLVASGNADALVVAKVAGKVISSYRVLAGHVVGLKALNGDLTVPTGRYLLLLGGTHSSYYAAFGYYGIYRLMNDHAHQMCAYGGPKVPRGGVTSTHKIIELLRSALRT